VIAGIVIAARHAARPHAGVSDGVPTGGTSRARKGDSIIATGSVSIASDGKLKTASRNPAGGIVA